MTDMAVMAIVLHIGGGGCTALVTGSWEKWRQRLSTLRWQRGHGWGDSQVIWCLWRYPQRQLQFSSRASITTLWSLLDGAGASLDGAGASLDGAGASLDGAGASLDGAGASLDGAGASLAKGYWSMPPF
jgi:hypothetical protein